MPNIVMCDPKGGDPYEIARKIMDGSITEYIDPQLTKIRQSAFHNLTHLTTVQVHAVTEVENGAFNLSTPISAIALPNLATYGNNNAMRYCQAAIVDIGPLLSKPIREYFLTDSAATTLILRKTSIVALGHIGSLPTAFQNGKSGGTIYIPKSLYDHLGDGTADDYKAASNWSTVDGYGTITWAKIEGSIYENQYADGTPIPSA